MKDYLTEPLSDEEKAELISIIWRVAKKYKIRLYEQNKQNFGLIDNLDLAVEDKYDYDKLSFSIYQKSMIPLKESQKTDIVNRINMLLDELSLFDLKRTLTFNEKLVFFLLSVERLKGVEIMKLLNIDKKTVYNRKKSIKLKISKIIGGVSNE